jgi:uncharacterized membrane protein YphA (DoxX/SURF4 family)
MMNGIGDELILVLASRLLLATLFLIFGWRKVRDYSGTLAQMTQLGLPMPVVPTISSPSQSPNTARRVATFAIPTATL